MIDLSNPLGQVFDMMPPETQEAMKVAHSNGADVQDYSYAGWISISYPDWNPHVAYRVKPAPIRETVTCWWSKDWGVTMGGQSHRDTHRITFDLIDGNPDCASIKMEPLK